jgi:hypothetical protein
VPGRLSTRGDPRGAHEQLRSLVRRHEDRAQEKAREVLTDRRGGRTARHSFGNVAGSLSAGRPAASYFPRDLFFCFTFKLTIGAFAPVPKDMGLGEGCFFDFPAMPILLDRGRVATDDPTLQAVDGCAVLSAGRASRQDAREFKRVGWLDWPCGQNPGRISEGRQRVSSARDDGASANRIHVAGPVLLPKDLRVWNSPSPTERKRQPRRWCDQGESLGRRLRAWHLSEEAARSWSPRMTDDPSL